MPCCGSCCKGREKKRERYTVTDMDRVTAGLRGNYCLQWGRVDRGGDLQKKQGSRRRKLCRAPPLLCPVLLWKSLNVSALPWLRAAVDHESCTSILCTHSNIHTNILSHNIWSYKSKWKEPLLIYVLELMLLWGFQSTKILGDWAIFRSALLQFI